MLCLLVYYREMSDKKINKRREVMAAKNFTMDLNGNIEQQVKKMEKAEQERESEITSTLKEMLTNGKGIMYMVMIERPDVSKHFILQNNCAL